MFDNGRMTLNLKKFDPSTMGDDKVCIFIGKRGTGKSTLVTDILWYKKHLPAGIAMSGTEDGNGWYKQFIPDIFVYSDYNVGALEKLIARDIFMEQELATSEEPIRIKELISNKEKELKTQISIKEWALFNIGA